MYGLSQIEAPERIPTLIELAQSVSLDVRVRREAVKALTRRGEGAQEALVGLLRAENVREEAAKALRYSKDPRAIAPLMKYVRDALSDYGLAMKAAHVIGFIDRDFVPDDTRDAVDFMLFFQPLEEIEKGLGPKARPRLKYSASSGCADMRERAVRALEHYRKAE